MDYNQMAIHTLPGCTLPDNPNQLSPLLLNDCGDSHTGCTVAESQPNSFAAAFAQAGGGVWATLFDESGIV